MPEWDCRGRAAPTLGSRDRSRQGGEWTRAALRQLCAWATAPPVPQLSSLQSGLAEQSEIAQCGRPTTVISFEQAGDPPAAAPIGKVGRRKASLLLSCRPQTPVSRCATGKQRPAGSPPLPALPACGLRTALPVGQCPPRTAAQRTWTDVLALEVGSLSPTLLRAPFPYQSLSEGTETIL